MGRSLLISLLFPLLAISYAEYATVTIPSPTNCNTNSNHNPCYPWQSYINNECVSCGKLTTSCDNTTWPCCAGTTCEPIPGLQVSKCVQNQNKCTSNSDCAVGFKCLLRLGKCGICREDGGFCESPYHEGDECCSGYCNISQYGYGVCKNLFKTKKLE